MEIKLTTPRLLPPLLVDVTADSGDGGMGTEYDWSDAGRNDKQGGNN